MLIQNSKLSVIASGAGSSLFSKLWSTPGSSSYLVGCYFPYEESRIRSVLKFPIEKFCSEDTAIKMAATAFMDAATVARPKDNIIGVGITASVASLVEHRGDHRYYIAIITKECLYTYSEVLPKGTGKSARLSDEENIAETAYSILDYINNPSSNLIKLSVFQNLKSDNEHKLEEVLGKYAFFTENLFYTVTPTQVTKYNEINTVYPGSFNPPHLGHIVIADEIRGHLGAKIAHEISRKHPLKGKLNIQDVLCRIAKLQDLDDKVEVIISNNSTFIDKFTQHYKCAFILGADTLDRIFETTWGYTQEKLVKSIVANDIKLYLVKRDNVFLKDIIDKYPIIKEIEERIFPFNIEHNTNYSSTYLRENNLLK